MNYEMMPIGSVVQTDWVGNRSHMPAIIKLGNRGARWWTDFKN